MKQKTHAPAYAYLPYFISIVACFASLCVHKSLVINIVKPADNVVSFCGGTARVSSYLSAF